MGHSPLTERFHHRAQALAGGREPVFMTPPIHAHAALNDIVVLELAQPANQYRPGNQRHAAMDVAEGERPRHQFAHDEWSPAVRENLRCLCDRAELTITRRH
jgi:hypothetical protein